VAPGRWELRDGETGRNDRLCPPSSPRSLSCRNLPLNKKSHADPPRSAWDFYVYRLPERANREGTCVFRLDCPNVQNLGWSLPGTMGKPGKGLEMSCRPTVHLASLKLKTHDDCNLFPLDHLLTRYSDVFTGQRILNMPRATMLRWHESDNQEDDCP
jgi:hypothetical protein